MNPTTWISRHAIPTAPAREPEKEVVNPGMGNGPPILFVHPPTIRAGSVAKGKHGMKRLLAPGGRPAIEDRHPRCCREPLEPDFKIKIRVPGKA